MPLLDDFDVKILDALQRDATMQIEDIAAEAGLSTSPCWRRIKRLEAEGIISRRVALLNRKKLNLSVTVFVAVRTNQHSPEWLSQFAGVVEDFPEVVEFYRMSGQIDYLLKIVVPDIDAYDAIYKRLISRLPVFDVSSMFAMEEIKASTVLPLNYTDKKSKA